MTSQIPSDTASTLSRSSSEGNLSTYSTSKSASDADDRSFALSENGDFGLTTKHYFSASDDDSSVISRTGEQSQTLLRPSSLGDRAFNKSEALEGLEVVRAPNMIYKGLLPTLACARVSIERFNTERHDSVRTVITDTGLQDIPDSGGGLYAAAATAETDLDAKAFYRGYWTEGLRSSQGELHDQREETITQIQGYLKERDASLSELYARRESLDALIEQIEDIDTTDSSQSAQDSVNECRTEIAQLIAQVDAMIMQLMPSESGDHYSSQKEVLTKAKERVPDVLGAVKPKALLRQLSDLSESPKVDDSIDDLMAKCASLEDKLAGVATFYSSATEMVTSALSLVVETKEDIVDAQEVIRLAGEVNKCETTVMDSVRSANAAAAADPNGQPVQLPLVRFGSSEPVAAGGTSFNRNDQRTWKLVSHVVHMNGSEEGATKGKLGKHDETVTNFEHLEVGSLSNRGSTCGLDTPCHAHIGGGKGGISFMYKTWQHDGETLVVPVVFDYAPKRPQKGSENQYYWKNDSLGSNKAKSGHSDYWEKPAFETKFEQAMAAYVDSRR